MAIDPRGVERRTRIAKTNKGNRQAGRTRDGIAGATRGRRSTHVSGLDLSLVGRLEPEADIAAAGERASPRGDARVHRRPYSGQPALSTRLLSAVSHERASGRIGSRSLARAIAGACVDARGVSRGACACRGRRYSSARARVCAPPRDANVDSPPVQLQREASEVKFYPASPRNVFDKRSRSFRRFNVPGTFPGNVNDAANRVRTSDARADARLVRSR